MTEEEAKTVLDWLVTGYGARLDQNQRPVWLSFLADLDPVPAMEVASTMASRARTGDRFPVPADFRRAVHQHQHPPQSVDHGDAAKFGHGKTPTWVDVWQFLRSEGDWRTLPQQEPYALAQMTQDEYEAERSRWAEETQEGANQPRWGPLTHTI